MLLYSTIHINHRYYRLIVEKDQTNFRKKFLNCIVINILTHFEEQMRIGIVKESVSDEKRVSAIPETVKKLKKKGFQIVIEQGAGEKAGFSDQEYVQVGAEVVDTPTAWGAEIVFKIHRPNDNEVSLLKRDSLLFALLEPYKKDGLIEKLAAAGIKACALELIPRTSRAQSMDVLSSQANIAGYRAVLEGASHYGHFLPVMMTSAGMAKAAKVVILGVGVAGLQAIATARRLGAQVEAFDVRSATREQVLSLGAKFIDLDLGEEGSGSGGYAKELSEEGKRKQQQLLGERLKKADIIITTANIPGKRSPILVTEETVQGMRAGSVIVDMAAANGGNCPLTELNKVTVKHGVTLVGYSNYPSLIAADSSLFFGNNLLNLLSIMIKLDNGSPSLNLDRQDDIIAATLVTENGGN